ncbi:MAG: ribonuclease III [Opitutaceae bacterium]
MPESFAALQRRLDYAFRRPALLEEALTHPSYAQDHPGTGENNQRLEFLGDAVLQLVLTGRLFELFPGEREGSLSKRRAALTKGACLAALARGLELDACLLLSASEEASGGRTKPSALEDAFEALVGALYVDGGWEGARAAVLRRYGDIPARLASSGEGENPKGRLQELVQPVHGNEALSYEVTQVLGADHARAYVVEARLHGRTIGQGRGSSKKLAEEEAARAALAGLEGAPGAPVR